MSVKKQLALAVDDLPEGLTLEEALARLYRAFKLKQLRDNPAPIRRLPAELRGTLQIHGNIVESALEPDSWDMLR